MTEHPLFYRRKIFLIFLLVWLLIAAVHAWWLLSGNQLMLLPALSDSLVYNLLFMILSVMLWFPMRALYQTRTDNLTLAGGYVLLVATVLTLWLSAGNGLLSVIPEYGQADTPVLSPVAPWRIITGFFYVLVMILVYYLILYYEEIREKTVKESELKSMMAETEIKALKAQLNPHFLFNTLNTMGNFLHTDPDQAAEMLIKLSQFLRYSLTHGEKKFVPVARELEYVSDYVDLIKMRFGSKLVFTQKIHEECSKVLIPVMILQPLVENAIQYSLAGKIKKGDIRLSCTPGEAFTELRLKNNYDPGATEDPGHGIGLKNIRKRLLLLYGRDDLLQIDNKDGIFEVVLRLPPAGDKKHTI